jgi:hypothetical protein
MAGRSVPKTSPGIKASPLRLRARRDRASHRVGSSRPKPGVLPRSVRNCRAKFLRYYPRGFNDPDYLELERGYKWSAHERWQKELSKQEFRSLLRDEKYDIISSRAVAIESRTNLLFSFEKMALRDALKSPPGARAFAQGLYSFIHNVSSLEVRFNDWIDVVADLPRKKTRVLTWPILTVMGFLAQPSVHTYLKPTVTKIAAKRYGFDFRYGSKPSWETYSSLLDFAQTVRRDLMDLRPRDMVDIQSFIWVQGSEEYPG